MSAAGPATASTPDAIPARLAELERREATLARNQQVLFDIVRDELRLTAPLDTVLRSITERVGRLLEIDRTSVWLFDREGTRSRCLQRWDNRARRHEQNGTMPPLLVDGALRQTLREALALVVDDVESDARVTAPMQAYFAAHAIRSCLYALISLPDRAIGVLVFAAGRPRAWSLADAVFARALADLLAHAFLLEAHREALTALDLAGEGIYVEDMHGTPVYVNRAAQSLRRDGCLPAPSGAPDDGEDAGESLVAWHSDVQGPRELIVRRRRLPGGSRVTLLRDVTEPRARERAHDHLAAQLRESAKMDALGRLAGGVAHDFNNMIGTIQSFASLLIDDLPADDPRQHFARRIVAVCGHAAEMVSQIVAFARGSQVTHQPIDLRRAVPATRALLEGALPGGVPLVIEASERPLRVLATEALLHQILLNLCLNACDAGPAPGAPIRIQVERVGRRHPDRDWFAGAAPAVPAARTVGGRLDPARAYAALRVHDRGAGMDQATLDRIFEPFFTTKSRGRGTGLGLAVVHGLMKSCGGAYAVHSRLRQGTCFSLYFPLIE